MAKKQIKFSIVLFVLYSINICLNLYNLIFTNILYILLLFLWTALLFITIKGMKKEKVKLNEYKKLQLEELKIVDYPKYIKEQRRDKLKRIKSKK
jgi:hypothetical protein